MQREHMVTDSMKQTKKEAGIGEELASHCDGLSQQNGPSDDGSHERSLDAWDVNFLLKCNICNKGFRSDSTLLAHVVSPRHHWKQKQFKMTSLDIHSNEAEMPNGADMMDIKEEGLACLNEDPKKAVILLRKAGKGFTRLNENEKAKECFQKALQVTERFLEDNIKEELEFQNDVFFPENGNDATKSNESLSSDSNSNCDENSQSCDMNQCKNNNNNMLEDSSTNSNGIGRIIAENESEFREGTQTRPRVKRFKMEQMNKMYSDYKLQRGTADLYETMIQCYAESFDIYLDDGAVQNENGQRHSFKVSEILMNRDLVLKELADTEKSYIDSLEFLVQTIIPEFNNSESQIIKDIKQNIFSNIEEIYEWHRSVFFEKIEDCLEDPELLGPTFKEHEKELTNLYVVYCQNKPLADDLLAQYSVDIDQVYQNIETSYTILDYLIKPVQRVMKYQLLLQSIIKYTRKMGENTESMEAALEVMEIVPKKVNDKMHLAMIIGYCNNLEKDELVLQDTLNISFGGGKTKPRPFRLFLFNEFLLFTEPVERPGRLPQYKFCLELKTCRMGVTQTVENDRLKFAIWFRKFKTTDIYVCTADTQEMKESWLKVLANVLSIHGGTISTDSIKSENTAGNRTFPRSNTWSAEKLARQATIGHPREYSMSAKLKANIQKYLVEEFYMNAQEADFDAEEENNNVNDIHKKYSEIYEKNGNSYRGKVSSFESIDEDECGCKQNGKIIKEGDPKNKKSFKIWKSARGKNRTVDKQEKQKRFARNEINQRSMSSPGRFMTGSINELELADTSSHSSDGNSNDSKVSLDDGEVFDLRSIAAEIQYLLVLNEDSLSWERAEQLLDKSLGLFYDVDRLKQISENVENWRELMKTCESSYRILRQRRSFADCGRGSDDRFYSYKGLYGFLMTYADLSAGNSSSAWPVFLYSLATAASKFEKEWKNSIDGYQKLSHLHKSRGNFEHSVDCLLEAYQIQLCMNDISSAASCLKDALEMALIAGNRVKCQTLETMSVKLLEKSEEMDIATPSLKLITEMSFAYKRRDYSWFNDNYNRIFECNNNSDNQDKEEFQELFVHLTEHLKERKQRISGEVFV